MTDWRWIGEELRARRRALNRSQQWVAERAEITQANLSSIEKGRTVPPLSTLERIADCLGLKVQIALVGAEATAAMLDLSAVPPRARGALRALADQLSGSEDER